MFNSRPLPEKRSQNNTAAIREFKNIVNNLPSIANIAPSYVANIRAESVKVWWLRRFNRHSHKQQEIDDIYICS